MTQAAAATTRLSRELEQRGISAKSIAEATGMSPWTIHKATKGTQSEETRKKIAAHLNLQPTDLGTITMGSRAKPRLAKPTQSARRQAQPAPQPEISKVQVSAPQPAKIPQSEIVLPPTPNKEALVMALFKKRKELGYQPEEVQVVQDWAEKVCADAANLKALLEGRGSVDVVEGQVGVYVDSSIPTASAPASASIKKSNFLDLVGIYLEEGVAKNDWQDYYVAEKRNNLKNFQKDLSLGSLEDLTKETLEKSIIESFKRGRSISTVLKLTKNLQAFYRWALESKLIAVNPIEGVTLDSNVKRLAKLA